MDKAGLFSASAAIGSQIEKSSYFWDLCSTLYDEQLDCQNMKTKVKS